MCLFSIHLVYGVGVSNKCLRSMFIIEQRRLFRLLHVLIHFMIFKRQRIIVQTLQIQGSAPRPMMRRSMRVRDWLRVAHPPQTQRKKWTRTKRLSRKRRKRKSKLMSLRDNYIDRTIWGYMPISAHAWIISHLHLSNLIWKSQLVYREFLWSFELYTVVCWPVQWCMSHSWW